MNWKRYLTAIGIIGTLTLTGASLGGCDVDDEGVIEDEVFEDEGLGDDDVFDE